MSESLILQADARLRLSADDQVLLWGILTGHRSRSDGQWPRLNRIIRDLELLISRSVVANDR